MVSDCIVMKHGVVMVVIEGMVEIKVVVAESRCSGRGTWQVMWIGKVVIGVVVGGS